MLELKMISAMDKCFLDQTPADFAEVKRLRLFKNESAAIQLLAYDGDETWDSIRFFKIDILGEAAKYATIRTVENVPNYIPAPPTPQITKEADSDYLRTTPGLYPDVLVPLTHHGCIPVLNQQLHAVRIDFDTKGKLKPGKYPTKIFLKMNQGDVTAECEFEVEILPFDLPEQDTRVTQWFYADCLCDYYGVEAFSKRHFEICESYIKTAVDNGINMILMPVFTPPLDTAIGGERTTVQLVGVTVENGRYSFDFSLCDRWIDMCDRLGVKYIEVSHLFTQWGAWNAPKIMATVNGEYKRIFGWETDAKSEEYVAFLRQFLKKFTEYLEKRGDKERTYFHISDEPNETNVEQYKANKQNVADVILGWKQLEAMSHVEFFKEGLCKIPVPSNSRIDDFLAEAIEERWVYYCCGPWEHFSNRFMAMPLARTRSICTQMYKYDVTGFLHWGYNFYNNRVSEDFYNPFLNANGGYWTSGGDCYSVYPAHDGTALESIRIKAFKEGLDDIRVMKLCESFYGKKRVVEEIEKIWGEVTFKNCLNDSGRMQAVRDKITDMILEAN